MTPTCQSGVELLMDFFEGVLAPDVHLALEQHVAGCVHCQAFVESYRRTPGIVRNATAVGLPVEVGRSLQQLLRRRLREGDA